MVTKAQKEATARYKKKVYESILVRTRKNDLPKKDIQAAADHAGESLNAYIIGAIKQRMKKQ